MLKLEAWMDIRDLHRQGHSIRTITQLTGLARNTVRRVIRQPAPQAATKRERSSRLDPFKSYLQARHSEYALSAVRLLAEIRGMGYSGGIDVVRRFIHSLDPDKNARQKMTLDSRLRPANRHRLIGPHADMLWMKRAESAPSMLS